MFRCQQCQSCVGPNVKSVRVVVQARAVSYPARPEVNRVKRRGRVKWLDDPGGRGTEAVRELTLCPRCARALTSSFSSTDSGALP